jgi:hypothetical protein
VQGAWDPGPGIDSGDSAWRSDLTRFNAASAGPPGLSDTGAITHTLLALLADVAPALAIPAGLPVGPKAEPWVNAASADPDWIAKTYDHLVFAYPTDAWKWIGVNRTIVQRTPAYTKTTLDHELLHAVDMYVAAFEYRLGFGNPPPAPPAALKPGYVPAASDPYGKYILDFRKYYEGGLSAQRHTEIYATSAAANFQHFSPDEKLAWFSSMITSVAPDIPASQVLPTEPLVAGVFLNPLSHESEIRPKFAVALFNVVRRMIYDARAKDLGKARTLVNHFTPAWNIQPDDRALLLQALRMEAPSNAQPAP